MEHLSSPRNWLILGIMDSFPGMTSQPAQPSALSFPRRYFAAITVMVPTLSEPLLRTALLPALSKTACEPKL